MLDIFFGFVVVVVETLLLAGGASRSSILGTVAMMIRDEGNMHLWKKDGMVGVDGIFTPFCFPLFVTI